jgi:ribosomal 50S subunit-recycling heat shock protein
MEDSMRLDKYLKVSRIFKRRTIAKEIAFNHRVLINDRMAKPGTQVVVGDILTITYGNKEFTVRILAVDSTPGKDKAQGMYELIDEKNSQER